ncbi:MAG: hypothetical protein CAK90_05175 [Spartobacteria bacterium AMD-G4]|nr:MAG: hypothetical protein CAK90_05175 [Spartobacteria bacterium AMD-G4]
MALALSPGNVMQDSAFPALMGSKAAVCWTSQWESGLSQETVRRVRSSAAGYFLECGFAELPARSS